MKTNRTLQNFQIFKLNNIQFFSGVACGPRYPLILRSALATWPVSASIANAKFPIWDHAPQGKFFPFFS